MNPPVVSQWPYVARLAFSLICVTILVYWMYVLGDIVTLLLCAILLSIAMYPLEAWLERKKVSRPIAISLSILIFTLLGAGVMVFLYYQVSDFTAMLPQLIKKVTTSLATVQQWAYQNFKISPGKQLNELQKYSQNIADGGGAVVGTAVSTTTNLLANLSILPVYVFFLLYYRDMFKTFLTSYYSNNM